MKHLLGIDELDKPQIEALLKRSAEYASALEKGEWDRSLLKNKIIMHLFFEHSTRTLTSFEMAAKRLGAQVIN